MAVGLPPARQGSSKPRKDDPFYRLKKLDHPEDIVETGLLGTGTYAKVYEIEYFKGQFAAKKLRSSFLQTTSQVSMKAFAKMLANKCYYQSKCSHRNIVQFIGIYYDDAGDISGSSRASHKKSSPSKSPRIPIMMMEKMECTLFELVNQGQSSLDKIISLLYDISRGLHYLHTQNPPLIHGDLNPHNVLINTNLSLQAKLSHVVAISDPNINTPGTVEFMPPEVLNAVPVYGPKVDVFSFGGVVLFVVTNEWPLPTEKVKFDFTNGRLICLSEVERRQKYIKAMKGEAELLKSLVKECLDNDPDIRPIIADVSTIFEAIQKEIKPRDHPVIEHDLENLSYGRHPHVVDQKLFQQKQELQQKDQELESVKQQLYSKEQELNEMGVKLRDTEQQSVRQIQEAHQYIKELQNDLNTLKTPTWAVKKNDILVLEGKELGKGAYGTVKEATFHGCRVAVKYLHNAIMSPYMCKLFEREMNMAARCRHPNLIQFIGASNEGQLFIVTELMHTSLRSIIQGKLRSSQIIPILLGVAYGLNYLHHSIPDPILHRDVSSANVLLNPLPDNQWHPKLSDFGSTNFMLDSHSVAAGNPSYAAPEALTGPYKPAMDVFSFGVLAYEMCSREFPSEKPTVESMKYVKWAATESGLISLIQQCISDNIEDRPTTDDVISVLNV